jgi:hypothetical protein
VADWWLFDYPVTGTKLVDRVDLVLWNEMEYRITI